MVPHTCTHLNNQSTIRYLNLANPMYPDRKYELDLRSYEQRELAKILIKLAVGEPGENWQKQAYRWMKSDDDVWGWRLPIAGTTSWTTEDSHNNGQGGPWRFGVLRLEFTTDEKYK